MNSHFQRAKKIKSKRTYKPSVTEAATTAIATAWTTKSHMPARQE